MSARCRPQRARSRGLVGAVATVLSVCVLLTGCSTGAGPLPGVRSARVETPATVAPEAHRPAPTSYDVRRPGPLQRSLLSADVLLTGARTLPTSLASRIRAIPGVAAVLPVSVAAVSVDGRTLTVAAVDPAGFRRFTPYATAYADRVWARVARGELALDPRVERKLVSSTDRMRLGTGPDAPLLRVGAYAPLVNRVQAVVNVRRGAQLGMPQDNALLVSTGTLTPSALGDRFRRVVGDQATLQTLALEFDVRARQTAVLSGTSVSAAVGQFTYTNRPRGEISPDLAWVREYIRTEPVPILGRVTCNKAVFPQLRAALAEVVRSGLAPEIHPDEYAGCYYPRYINRNPADGLSLHSWGIALDLNVPGNQRGTVGEIDRRVVAVFKKWGFAWGGDWRYTDPMHFEMSAVVRPR